MKTQYYTASSLDGFLATKDHSLDWLFQFGDPEDSTYPEFIRDIGAVAMGSSTYEWMLRHHLKPGTADEQPWPYAMPAWVFSSRSRTKTPGADIRFVQGDVRPIHQEMVSAAGGKNIWIAGGGDLAGQFYDQGLLDELIVQVAAVTLGEGCPLFPRQTKPLRLTSAKPFGAGFVELRYDVPRQS